MFLNARQRSREVADPYCYASPIIRDVLKENVSKHVHPSMTWELVALPERVDAERR